MLSANESISLGNGLQRAVGKVFEAIWTTIQISGLAASFLVLVVCANFAAYGISMVSEQPWRPVR
jgi:hypothetical protein